MIVTLNEVEQWCLRALAGAPAGVDEDAAAAAAWLVARGFPALELLVAALDRCGDAAAAVQATAQCARRFDAGGHSAVFLAGVLVDNAVAAAASDDATARITVAALSDPLYLLPVAERYRRRGSCFELLWEAGGARLDGGGTCLLGVAPVFATAGPVTVSIACGAQSPDGAALPVAVRPRDLEARYASTLEHGVTVTDQTWSRLKALGMRALVPASEASRVRGAGSAASDNE